MTDTVVKTLPRRRGPAQPKSAQLARLADKLLFDALRHNGTVVVDGSGAPVIGPDGKPRRRPLSAAFLKVIYSRLTQLEAANARGGGGPGANRMVDLIAELNAQSRQDARHQADHAEEPTEEEVDTEPITEERKDARIAQLRAQIAAAGLEKPE